MGYYWIGIISDSLIKSYGKEVAPNMQYNISEPILFGTYWIIMNLENACPILSY